MPLRKTKIVATIGPATSDHAMLEQLVRAGMNVARLNMSHADAAQATEIVKNLREISSRLNVSVGILMDTQGPAIRTGDLPIDLNLEPGQRLVLTVRGEKSEEHVSVDVNYDQLVDDIGIGDIVIVDNGSIELKVLEKRKNQLHCEVLTPGVLGSRRHINLPGVRVNLPGLTEKDIKDVELGIELGVDFFAMSFVRTADDVRKLKNILDYRKSRQKVIAKLEDQEGLSNLDDIIEASDGIMVARGDLGVEVPYEELPIIQRRIVKKCIEQGKPVIVATHMLESMIENPAPTRAEITDVANAVFEQADAIMLSGETSVGRYPIKCIEIMDRIARRIERSGGASYADAVSLDTKYAKLVKSASMLAGECSASALIVFTKTGRMARNTSWLRPDKVNIFAFTGDQKLMNQLSLYWGLNPCFYEVASDQNENVVEAIRILREQGITESGGTIVTLTEATIRGKLVDTIQLEEVE
ncbi:MAG: pyruvate kinase [Verrucomicrobiales bacterium]|jgi:pyruvate kinase